MPVAGSMRANKITSASSSSNQRSRKLDEVFPNERRPRCPVGATLSLWRQDVATAVPRWPPSSAISHILPSAQQFCPATSPPRLMPKTAGALLHAGWEEEAKAATVDPNGSKCTPFPLIIFDIQHCASLWESCCPVPTIDWLGFLSECLLRMVWQVKPMGKSKRKDGFVSSAELHERFALKKSFAQLIQFVHILKRMA